MKGSVTLLVALLHVAGGTASAHRGDRTVPIPELTDEDLTVIDVHDGSIADWLSVLGEAQLTQADFDLPRDPTLAFRVWLAWHGPTSRIFVAVEAVDDVYWNSYEGTSEEQYGNEDLEMPMHDGFVGIGVDGDHSGGQYFHDIGYLASLKSTAQAYHVLGNAAGGRSVALSDAGGKAFQPLAQEPPLADGGGTFFSEQPTVTITEAYVTAFDLLDRDMLVSRPSLLAAGRTIGLALKVHDADRDYRETLQWGGKYRFPGGRWGREPADIENEVYWTYADADLFGDAVLVTRQVDDGTADEAPSITWARLKARFAAEWEGISGKR